MSTRYSVGTVQDQDVYYMMQCLWQEGYSPVYHMFIVSVYTKPDASTLTLNHVLYVYLFMYVHNVYTCT